MLTHRKVQPLRVVGPLGEALTLRTLPPRDTKRWIVRRKAEVVAAVRGGLITSDEACARYRLSRSEEHTSELQSLMRNSYAVFCLKKKKNKMNYRKRSVR